MADSTSTSGSASSIYNFDDLLSQLDKASSFKSSFVLNTILLEYSPKWVLAKLAKDDPSLTSRILQLLLQSIDFKEKDQENKFYKDFNRRNRSKVDLDDSPRSSAEGFGRIRKLEPTGAVGTPPRRFGPGLSKGLLRGAMNNANNAGPSNSTPTSPKSGPAQTAATGASKIDWDSLDAEVEEEIKKTKKIDWDALSDSDDESDGIEYMGPSLKELEAEEEETEEERKRREKVQKAIWAALDAEVAEMEEEKKKDEPRAGVDYVLHPIQQNSAPSGSRNSKRDGEEEVKVLKSGYLTKLGGKMKNWKKRWIVLEEKRLSYYKRMGDKERTGVINLEALSGLAFVIDNRKLCIQLSTPDRVFLLQSDNKADLENWFYCIEATFIKIKLTTLKEKSIMLKVVLPTSQLTKLVKLDLFLPVEDAKKVIFSKFKGATTGAVNEYRLYHVRSGQWLDDSKALLMYFLDPQDEVEFRIRS
eukprot:TRINITY_DN4227_c0_g1_i1.p1 TRINITY_DN4227_c0_g1~~TRINITY_DN4227_c0_g1_i1.p1  ORF type:complete len:473 (+),score=110.32 TRINITY_DN4227_c0_g1_i1:121-1539(+)